MADKKVVLVAESLQSWQEENKLDEQVQQLNEGAKAKLKAFIKNPENKKKFIAAYARQMGKSNALKNAVAKMDSDELVKLAKQSYQAMEKDPKKGYPWLQIANNKIVGAGALGVQKAGVGKELGA
jgi:uncharacterized protein with von Willebrand factor type A (vWA) domain